MLTCAYVYFLYVAILLWEVFQTSNSVAVFSWQSGRKCSNFISTMSIKVCGDDVEMFYVMFHRIFSWLLQLCQILARFSKECSEGCLSKELGYESFFYQPLISYVTLILIRLVFFFILNWFILSDLSFGFRMQ